MVSLPYAIRYEKEARFIPKEANGRNTHFDGMCNLKLNKKMDCVLEQLNTAVCMLPSIDSYPNAVLACSMKDKALVQIYMNWDIISN